MAGQRVGIRCSRPGSGFAFDGRADSPAPKSVETLNAMEHSDLGPGLRAEAASVQWQGDNLAMTWAQYQNGRLRLRQAKTGAWIEVPAHRVSAGGPGCGARRPKALYAHPDRRQGVALEGRQLPAPLARGDHHRRAGRIAEPRPSPHRHGPHGRGGGYGHRDQRGVGARHRNNKEDLGDLHPAYRPDGRAGSQKAGAVWTPLQAQRLNDLGSTSGNNWETPAWTTG